jgi:FkbM family methyltransferase
MKPVIERILPSGSSVASVLFAPLSKGHVPLEFVDVGARNGSFILPPSYAAHCRITGFEPNPVEYEKLKLGRTDSMRAGAKEPAFKERRYYPYGVWSSKCERTLYITIGPGAVSLTGPVNAKMVGNMYLAADTGESYLDRHQRVVSTQSIPCVALDDLWPEPTSVIDVLKLDVEGGELEVLKGARKLLSQKRVLLVKAEFLLAPYYEDRVTLGHQQVFLDELGYRLIGLESDQSRYSWRPTKINSDKDKWMSYAGDAVYVLDPDRNSLSPEISYRLGLACMAMGFNAFGLNLIRESGQVGEAEIVAIEQEANRIPLFRRLRKRWLAVPDAAYRILRRLGRRD